VEIDKSQMYRVSAVARLLDVSPSTVYRAIDAGALPALRIGSTVRVHGSALAAWLGTAAGAAASDATPGSQL